MQRLHNVPGEHCQHKFDKRMSVDYRNKTIQPPLGTCYNPSDLWEIQMYKQLLEQNNHHCFPILKFHVPSHEEEKQKIWKWLQIYLLPYLGSSRLRWKRFSAGNWFLDKMGIKEVKIGTQTMFSSSTRLQTAAWWEGLAAAWAVPWWYDKPGFSVSDGGSEMLCLPDTQLWSERARLEGGSFVWRNVYGLTLEWEGFVPCLELCQWA